MPAGKRLVPALEREDVQACASLRRPFGPAARFSLSGPRLQAHHWLCELAPQPPPIPPRHRHRRDRRRPQGRQPGSYRRDRRPGEPGARHRDRHGQAMAGTARPPGDRVGRARQPRRLRARRLRQGLPRLGRLHDQRRRHPAARPQGLPLSSRARRRRADRRHLGPRHRALHGNWLLQGVPGAADGPHAGRGGPPRPVPRRHDPPSADPHRGSAAQAPVRHRPLPAHGPARMAPSWCCTAIRTCRAST